MADDVFDASLAKRLAAVSTPQAIRAVEAGGGIDLIWREAEASGFLDALVPASRGGAGLTMGEARGLFFLCGRYAVPAPIAPTALFRALAGAATPRGPVTLAPNGEHVKSLVARDVPFGLVADWVLVPLADRALLMPAKAAMVSASGVHGSLRANFEWLDADVFAMALEGARPWLEAGALISAGAIAGALDYLIADTVRHVNAREQFGRPIAKFQAVQQQMAVLAARAHAARMALDLACEGEMLEPARVGAAKIYTSQAAPLCASIAHALHGAIGMTGEYDLQIHTRRLHEWRADYGSESYWSGRLGRSLLEATGRSALDFMLDRLV